MTDTTRVAAERAVITLPTEFVHIIDEEDYPDIGTIVMHLRTDDRGVAYFQRIEFGTDMQVAPGDMRSFPWQRIADICVREELLNQYYRYGHPETDEDWAAAEALADGEARRMRRRRNKITDELLADVATAYRNGADPEMVAEQFKVGRRQADRYIARAFKQGMLP